MTPENSNQYPIVYSESPNSLELRPQNVEYAVDYAIRDHLVKLRRHWRMIACFTGSFILLAGLVCILMTPSYDGKVVVEVNPQPPKVTNFPEFMSDPSKQDEAMQSQVQIFQSFSLADRVIANLKLASNPDFNPLSEEAIARMGVFAKLKVRILAALNTVKKLVIGKREPSSGIDYAQLEEQTTLRTVFRDNLSVTPISGTKVIALSFSSPNPVLARDIVNELINEYMRWELDRKREATKIAKKQLDEQIKSVGDQLAESEKDFREFTQKSGIVSLDSKTNLLMQELEQINQALAAAEVERIRKMEVFNQAKRGDLWSIPAVIQNPLIQTLKREQIDLMAEYEKVRVVFKSDYPDVQRIRAKIDDITRRMTDEQNKIRQSLMNDYQTVEKTAKVLSDKAGGKLAQVLQMNAVAGDYKMLQNKAEMNKHIYLSLIERSQQIDANVGTDLGKIQVMDMSTIPLYPSKPNIPLYLSIACLLGLMSGTGWVFLKEFLDSSIKKVNEVANYHCPILGVIPLLSQKELLPQNALVKTVSKNGLNESLRFARVLLSKSLSSNQAPKSMLITSISPGDGKTTVAVRLARSFADAGERVLLIDTDLRKPLPKDGISKVFRLKHGLAHYLNRRVKADDVVQRSDVPNLSYIHSGCQPVEDPSALLDTDLMKKMIADFYDRYDRIILDAPPFGADVLILGGIVDGVILITSLGRTPRQAIEVARESLLRTNGRLLGIIINKVDLKKYPDARNYQSHYSQGGSKAGNYLVEAA